MSSAENADSKKLLDRIVAMLTKLGQRGYSVREEMDTYDTEEIDSDRDTDTDSDSDSDIPSRANRSGKENTN